jgi:penicillin V acylase-like amidase (Ntn superfamily)
MTSEEADALKSIILLDDYPLYSMHLKGANEPEKAGTSGSLYEEQGFRVFTTKDVQNHPMWGCSLFAALGDTKNMLFGRNFDWQYSHALLFFYDPPDGYSSVSMVDITYLGFSGKKNILKLSLKERAALIEAVEIPFDGMNEYGVAVGMAALESDGQRIDPNKPSIDSLMVIREILDHSRTVDEAIAIIEKYNIIWGNGPPLHYLVADQSGNSVLVEFYQGEIQIIRSSQSWHIMTNFNLSQAAGQPMGKCRRYDRISQKLEDSLGQISNQEAISLLEDVSQSNTQWSVLYGLTNSEIRITMGKDFNKDPMIFQLK